MSSASERPASKRSDTATPFATLPPRSTQRTSTGPRVKIQDAPDSGPFADPLPVSQVDPDRLQRPFASLIPAKPVPTEPGAAPAAAPPPPPSQLFAETSSSGSQTSPRPGSSSEMRSRTSRRPESTQAGRYGTCKEHGTALTREGTCVLCVRAEAKRKSERGWKLMVLAMVLALVVGGVVAFALMPKAGLQLPF